MENIISNVTIKTEKSRLSCKNRLFSISRVKKDRMAKKERNLDCLIFEFQISTSVHMERMTGIEPAYSAWEADVLPLNYIRDCKPLYNT